MKKVMLSILTIIYMTVSSGVAMDIHFCMGKRTGVDLYAQSNTTCGRCGMKEKKGGCCNDEHRFYKLSDAHKIVNNEHKFTFSFITHNILPAYPGSYPLFFNKPVISIIPSPPGDPQLPLYISHCIFRI